MDIYQALKKDHEELKQLLSDLVNLKENDDYRFFLVEEIANLVIPHSRAEESVFYNTLRAVNADKKVVFHGFQEHLEAETLLRTLQVMDSVDLAWKPIAAKLKDAIEHHIEEEESDIFSEARSVFTKDEAISMAEAFESLKPKVAEEGFIKNTIDLVINMMPPRLADKIRDIGTEKN
ncbi:MAG TPA: hemerythrin domain-containing protein [Bacteriovoracaceae bacterium]|nr:hemerythrin domain-containing protein [Bacteriovoracaceae bacterium]